MARHSYKEHMEQLSLNDRIAISVTNLVGTMWCAYTFTILAFVALPQAIESHSFTIFVNWVSSNWIQLVLLPIIIVGQKLQNKHSEIQSEAAYQATLESEQRIKELQTHVSKLELSYLAQIAKKLKIKPQKSPVDNHSGIATKKRR